MCQRGTGNTIFPKTHNTLVYYRIPPAAVSVAAVSVAVAAVSAAATITVSADIAAAFWLIVVCPRLPLFRSPSHSSSLQVVRR